MPKISIIIPNYNTEKYLPRCLDSLIHQSFQDIEIIVIDDGSKDRSVAVIQSYQDDRIRLLHHQGDGFGPGGARNMGLDAATGKYIMFCDSDDWYEQNMCQKMYETIEREKVDVVCCQNYFDVEEGLSQAEINYRQTKQKDPSGKYTLTDNKVKKTNVLLWNKIWRRDVIEQYHIRFIPKNEHDDDAFWYMYGAMASTIYYIKEKLYHYFLRENSIMSAAFQKKPKNPLNRFQVCLAVFEFFKENQVVDKHKNLILKVFKSQMKGAASFLKPETLKEQCDTLNNIIKNDLKTDGYLVIGEDSVFWIGKMAKLRFWLELKIAYVRKWIYHIKKKEEKLKKYERVISQLKAVLKMI